jgi:hypothetical protein
MCSTKGCKIKGIWYHSGLDLYLCDFCLNKSGLIPKNFIFKYEE